MQIVVGSGKMSECVITRVTIINKGGDVHIPVEYRCMFHGADRVGYGRHVFRFPVTHIGYKRMVSKFQSEFAGRMVVDLSMSAIDEV
jgi:hypothetical protein